MAGTTYLADTASKLVTMTTSVARPVNKPCSKKPIDFPEGSPIGDKGSRMLCFSFSVAALLEEVSSSTSLAALSLLFAEGEDAMCSGLGKENISLL